MKKQWTAAAVFAALFLALIVLLRVCDVAAIGPAGTSVGLSGINGAVRDVVGVNMTLYAVTGWCGRIAIAVALIVAVIAAVRILRKKNAGRALPAILALYAALGILYVLFEIVIVNYRPILMEGETFPEASFPSSHTMLAVGIWGSLGLLCDRVLHSRRVKAAVWAVSIVLLVVTVAGRVLAGVHWATDILGGVLIGAALLSAYAAFCDGGRKQSAEPAQQDA